MARPVSEKSNPLYQRMAGETFCCVCSKEVEYPAQLLATGCNHYFHHVCFSTATGNSKVCPICKTALSKSTLSLAEELSAAQSSGIQTRSKSKSRTVAQDLLVAGSSNSIQTGIPEPVQQSCNDNPALVAGPAPVVQPMFSLQQSIAEAVAAALTQQTHVLSKAIEDGFHRMSFNSVAQGGNDQVHSAPRQSSPARQQQHQSFEQLFGISNRDGVDRRNPVPEMVAPQAEFREMHNLRPDRISQTIYNWKVRFSGHSSMTVEDFLYRVEALTNQTLGGDFEMLARYASNLFEGSASEWFWRYHRSVTRVRWIDLSIALRAQFSDGRTDLEIRTAISHRKQKPNETFDNFYEAIVNLADRLEQPMSEQSLLEVLRANLLIEVQHELLYVPINNVVQLRQFVRKRERFLLSTTRSIPATRRFGPRPQINEVSVQAELATGSDREEDESFAVEAVIISCWNCRKPGHHYQDCKAERTVFCYGCGDADTYRPSCRKCISSASKNGWSRAPLTGARKLISKATNTE
ncbi:uncharacterized protein LOC127565466 [Drosophila albomicans]|uniref:Uncharacterized protein LOC127565466 n=1 Tax=Drosophila albomicans TaxID=7291 RepID=A0A9C6T583_DROAB|nr:uncharacterized protein LOC127565466 [Drosophila albomicans]